VNSIEAKQRYSFSSDVFNQNLLSIHSLFIEYQIGRYETAFKCALQDLTNQPQNQPLEQQEGLLNEKELKNLKTWRSNVKFGGFVKGTNIFPCKTFLCEDKWQGYMGPSEHFHISDLANHLNKHGMKIGLIMDLNRTMDYYNFEKLKAENPLLADTRYRKFKLQNGAVPCPDAVTEVVNVLRESQEKGEVTVIHCFNGINRTGYMICEYLCRFLGLDGQTAIKRFEEARNHQMEHECMTSDLKAKYPSLKEEL